MMMGQPQGPAMMASPPSPNPGLAADALTKVREAARLLEMALPNLQLGSDEHKTVMSAIGGLAKIAPASAAVPGLQAQTLSRLQEDAQKSAPLMALARMFGGANQNAPQGAPINEDEGAEQMAPGMM